ncbi:MAG: methionyl-tRNA formyltransferase [Candidatus Moraniibacteriota bacterium]
MTDFLDLTPLKEASQKITVHNKKEAPKQDVPVLQKIEAPKKVVAKDLKLRTIFMGTPEFAADILSSLVEQKYNIVAVVTKRDKPVGRKQEAIESAVKKKALEYKIPLLQPVKIDEETIEGIKNLEPDLIIVAAYGKILPKEILSIPGFGCINVHASLLPKLRGSSPIQNALLSGATETGITIMLMDEGMDTGDILAQTKIDIAPEDTKESLSERLTKTGQQLLIETLPRWIERTLISKPQNHEEATLCQLIEREDGHIMWTDRAESIYNRFRALSPWPGIFTFWKKEAGPIRLKLHRISYQKQSPQTTHSLGQVFEMGEKIGVQTREGVIFLEEIQLEGKTQLPITEFLRGNPDIIGSLLQ